MAFLNFGAPGENVHRVQQKFDVWFPLIQGEHGALLVVYNE